MAERLARGRPGWGAGGVLAGRRERAGSGKTVTAHGLIVTVGGPFPGAPAPIPRAELRFVGSRRSMTVRADAHGRFAFDAPPGLYRVQVTGNAPTANGAFLPTVPDTVAVFNRTV